MTLRMSHNSAEEQAVEPSSDSFWEPGNFRRTTKRIEDGNKLCTELTTLLQERAELEKSYATSLSKWTKKWFDAIEKGPEYGTIQAAWRGVLVEADRISEVHTKIRDSLLKDINPKIKDWQKEHFHKTMIAIKEKKEKDDEFKKAQKDWAKKLQRVNKCKADYHSACKNERTAVNQERNAERDSSLSEEQQHKYRDRVDKAKVEMNRAKEQYESALRDINEVNSRYMEDMTAVFDKCQEMEAERLKFFKEILFQVHQGLNISALPELPQIYEELHHTISNADDEKDLRWWSNNHGANMPMNWPRFEEYVEEFRDIAGKKGTTKVGVKNIAEDHNITLITQRSVTDDLPSNQGGNKKGKGKSKDAAKIKAAPTHGGGGGGVPNNESAAVRNNGAVDSHHHHPHHNAGGEDEDWDEDGPVHLVDTGEPGVPVKALYDYEGMESDELSFKAGDIFEKLEEEDEQGWCKGRKDNRVGLYPANYVETVR